MKSSLSKFSSLTNKRHFIEHVDLKRKPRLVRISFKRLRLTIFRLPNCLQHQPKDILPWEIKYQKEDENSSLLENQLTKQFEDQYTFSNFVPRLLNLLLILSMLNFQ